MVDNKE